MWTKASQWFRDRKRVLWSFLLSSSPAPLLSPCARTSAGTRQLPSTVALDFGGGGDSLCTLEDVVVLAPLVAVMVVAFASFCGSGC